MLTGNLADLPLLELLQTLAAGSGGTLRIRARGVEGTVGFARRRVVFAEALGLSGLDALILLTGLRQGPFEYTGKPPPEENFEASLEAVLTELAGIADEWKRLTHLPEDWGRVLRQAASRRELELALDELGVFADAEGKTVAEVLAVPGEVLARARVLDRLLRHQVLAALPSLGVGPITLVALPYYGPQSQMAYVDYDLYQRWAEEIGEGFKLRVRSPRGIEASFPVEPRQQIPDRIMLHDRELKKLRAGRGTRLKVIPEVEDGPIKP